MEQSAKTIIGEDLSISEAAAMLGLPIGQLESWALRGIGPEFHGNAMRPYLTRWPLDRLMDWKAGAMAQPFGECIDKNAGNIGPIPTKS